MSSEKNKVHSFDVFVSYSSKEKAVADAVVSALENEGIRCWYAPRDIEPGADWADSITKAIHECKMMVLVFSKNANRSQRVVDEINYAISQEKIILPFRIEAYNPTGALGLHLSSRHWLDAYEPSWEAHLDRLVKSVSINLDSAGDTVQISGGEDDKVVEGTPGGAKSIFRYVNILAGIVILALGGYFGWRFFLGGPSSAPEPTEIVVTSSPTSIPPDSTPRFTRFKIGILGPFSGPSAQTGKQFKGGAQLALEEFDYKIGHYLVEPVWIDSQSDPTLAVQAYENAINKENIQVGVLNWHSSVAVAVMEITAKHKIPHIFGFGATDIVNETFESDLERYGYWTTKGWPTPAKLGNKYVDALEYYIDQGVYSPESKTVAIYGEDSSWCRSFGAGLTELFEEAGWEIISEDYFPLEQTEYNTYLNHLKDLDPEVLAGTSTYPPQITSLINQADEVGLESLMITDGLGWIDFCSLTGESASNVIDQIASWSGEEGFAFAEEFEERYNLVPLTASAGLAHDGVKMAMEIFQEVYDEHNELTSELIQEFIEENVWTGKWTMTDGLVMMEYKYTEETIPDPVVGPGFFNFPVLQYEYVDGTCLGKPIYPAEGAVQNLQLD
jgi:branched-chain amino acid transport system substrate-binding protein